MSALPIDATDQELYAVATDAGGKSFFAGSARRLFEAGVEAERARAAAEVGIDEEEFVVRYVMAAAETGRTYAAVHFGDEVNGDGEIETMETVARRAHTIASEMLDESIGEVQS